MPVDSNANTIDKIVEELKTSKISERSGRAQDEDHRHHDSFLEHFRKIDQVIGEIAACVGDDDLLVMLSDHGFERLDYDVYISYLLAQERFLQFKQGRDISLDNICHGTKAFALDPARIYLNLKGKFPYGTVGQAGL